MGYPSRWEAKCTSPHTSPELSWCWCCDVDADADVYSSAVGYLAGSSSVGVCMCVLHPRTWRLGAPSARFSPAQTQLKACQLMQATRCCPAASSYASKHLPHNLEFILDMESSFTVSDIIHRLEVRNIESVRTRLEDNSR